MKSATLDERIYFYGKQASRIVFSHYYIWFTVLLLTLTGFEICTHQSELII